MTTTPAPPSSTEPAERRAAIDEARQLIADLYLPSIGWKRLSERDQSAPAQRERDNRVRSVTARLRALGLDEQAKAIEDYHADVNSYVDGQQALDPAEIRPGMIRDHGTMWLPRMYDHARQLLGRAEQLR